MSGQDDLWARESTSNMIRIDTTEGPPQVQSMLVEQERSRTHDVCCVP